MAALTDSSLMHQKHSSLYHQAASCPAVADPRYHNAHQSLRTKSRPAAAHFYPHHGGTGSSYAPAFASPAFNLESPYSWQLQDGRLIRICCHVSNHSMCNGSSCFLGKQATDLPSVTYNWRDDVTREYCRPPGTMREIRRAPIDPYGYATYLQPPPSPNLTRGLRPNPKHPLGPPEKPIQSGSAIWVGNLPPHTDLIALKDYFSQHAASEIVSIKYIRKSCCAFVNYRSLEVCFQIIRRLDRQYFFGNKLICRARTYTENGKTIKPAIPGGTAQAPCTGTSSGEKFSTERRDKAKTHSRFFIMKSLTTEDLEASVQSGTWIPQAHNEEALNEAYHDTAEVWLIFSVNQSHEFFGVARMISDLKSADTGQATLVNAPASTPVAAEPCYVHVPASRWAPAGVIYEDKMRDILWWESTMPDNGCGRSSGKQVPLAATDAKPFRLQWVSLRRVPFRRIRGMVNRLNNDRPVQMARDGTPLAADAGQKLLHLFGVPHASRSPLTELTEALSRTSRDFTPCPTSASEPFPPLDYGVEAGATPTAARPSSSRSSVGTLPSLTKCSSFSSNYSAVDSSEAPSVADTVDDEEPLPPGPVVNGSLGRRRWLSL